MLKGVNDLYLDQYLSGRYGELMRREALDEILDRARENAQLPETEGPCEDEEAR